MNNYRITYNGITLNGMSYTMNVPQGWGTVKISMPLAEHEKIDMQVEKMTEFPQVMKILQNFKS